MWTKTGSKSAHVRTVTGVDRAFVDANKGKALPGALGPARTRCWDAPERSSPAAIVERVLDGSTVRVEILSTDASKPLAHRSFNLFLAGVQAPRVPPPPRRERKPSKQQGGDDDADGESGGMRVDAKLS
jgi:hypothetical protein